MFEVLRILLIFAVTLCVLAKPTDFDENEPKKCGYDSCHPVKKNMINVHLVPHTHDDVGWLKTVDQYYYGAKNKIQKASVEDILDSVIEELLKDPQKRFIYVETAFFWKWWSHQHDILRHKVKRLVNNGQLEFIGGAWAMNDEAVTNYQSIIDQFAWGLRKLNETFGECGRPKIGWQIDPFGHSREMASIFAQLGFDGLLFGRLDYMDKNTRLTTKTGEMVWRGSDSLGNSSNLFTSVLYNGYDSPPGFCFDINCEDDPIIDDKLSPEYNIDVKIEQLKNYTLRQANYYQTNNVLMTMGGDFHYMAANSYFQDLDKIIRYANALQKDGSNVNFLYSTPSCYLKAVYDAKPDREWPVKSDDFFPYASDPHTYWTGYYTSRPTLKRYERMGNNFLQICKQLYAITDLGPEDWVDLSTMREAMGVMQHHDAITGTEKQHVAQDYARQLSQGFADCEVITKTALNKLMVDKSSPEVDIPQLSLTSCNMLNVSQCSATERTKTFVVTVYNPLSRIVSQIVRLPVVGEAYEVTGPQDEKVNVQIIPVPKEVLRIPGRESDAQYEVVFKATDIPPLGFKSYYVKKLPGSSVSERMYDDDKKDHLENENIRINIDLTTNRLSSIKFPDLQINAHQEFLYYKGMTGNNAVFKNRSSGAYIFRPDGENAIPITKKPHNRLYRAEDEGCVVEELHQKINEWISQVVRLYKGDNHVELEWLVGPIPITDGVGKEVITRFTTELKNNGTFYTDSNGRSMLKRVRNYRPTWKLNNEEPVAGNYYPVTSKISIRDESGVDFSVLTDRAQGGSSIQDGEVELMVHRRLLHDDAFGVGEALNETAFGEGLVARGQHYIVVGNTDEIKAVEKDIAQRKLLSAWTFISPVDMPYDEYKTKYHTTFSGLTRSLPKNVQILTLEPWKANTFLLRLEHVFEKDEHHTLSKPVTVDLQTLFVSFTINSIRETTLGANQWLSENKRMDWKLVKPLEEYNKIETRRYYLDTNDVPKDGPTFDVILESEGYEKAGKEKRSLKTTAITLDPMQIRTFVIEITKK